MEEPAEFAIFDLYNCNCSGPVFFGCMGRIKGHDDASGSGLVGMISAELQSRSKDLLKEQQDLLKHDQTGYRTKTIEACKAAAAALSKIAPEEAMAYKKWALAIGQKVAEAAKEHGVAVSDPEKAVLGEVSAALGTGA
jgi:hypothetical protein